MRRLIFAAFLIGVAWPILTASGEEKAQQMAFHVAKSLALRPSKDAAYNDLVVEFDPADSAVKMTWPKMEAWSVSTDASGKEQKADCRITRIGPYTYVLRVSRTLPPEATIFLHACVSDAFCLDVVKKIEGGVPERMTLKSIQPKP